MTEYELVDLALTSLGHLDSSALYCSTTIFAYLAAAYIVGDKLPSAVLWFLTIVYTGALFAPIAGMRAAIRSYNGSVLEYAAAYPDGLAFIGGESSQISMSLAVLTFLPILIAWLGSIVFMHFYMARRRIEETN